MKNTATMALKFFFGPCLMRMCSRHFAQSSCPPHLKFREKFDVSDQDPNWQSLPECKETPPNCSARADDVNSPLKNHKRPYREQFCDPEPAPIQLFRYKRQECCIDLGPRRPRKVPVVKDVNKACDGHLESVGGATTTDKCRMPPVKCPGCRPARVPNICFDVRDPEFCDRVAAPTVSFHDCVKRTVKDLPPDECHCHIDQQPPCTPTKRKNVLADR